MSHFLNICINCLTQKIGQNWYKMSKKLFKNDFKFVWSKVDQNGLKTVSKCPKTSPKMTYITSTLKKKFWTSFRAF